VVRSSAASDVYKRQCFMKAKTRLPNAECPVGKWGKIIKESEDKK
jgi:hypothetical protein